MKYSTEVLGKKFNRLEVTGLVGSDGKATIVAFRCDCGVEGEAPMWRIASGAKRSCGCLRREKTVARNTSHGLSHLPEYKVWINIHSRCYNPEVGCFNRYGATGIHMSPEWEASFEAFYRDMGPRPSPEHSVERVNNLLGYSGENCVWATKVEQARNKRSNVNYTVSGVTKTLKEWASDVGLDYHAAYWRHQQGWPIDRILSTPSRRKPRKLPKA